MRQRRSEADLGFVKMSRIARVRTLSLCDTRYANHTEMLGFFDFFSSNERSADVAIMGCEAKLGERLAVYKCWRNYSH